MKPARASDATRRAAKVWQQTLEAYRRPTQDPAIGNEPDAFIARCEEMLRHAEP